MRDLYLDTARLGQATPSALKAHLDFARLTCETPSSLYFENFLQFGDRECGRIQSHFPGIANWPGVRKLQAGLCDYAGSPPGYRVALGSRSGSLFEVAATALFAVAATVLVTDLTWLPHLSRLRVAALKRGRRIVYLRLRNAILKGELPMDEVVSRIAAAYVENDCQAVVLPKVDNLGIKLPVGHILGTIKNQAELRFAVVDAAQALGHVALDDCWGTTDVLLASAHKWLCAGQPLSLAFYGRPQSKDIIEHYAFRTPDPRANYDPLLGFAEQLSGGQTMNHPETVNIAPLFSCFGALADANRDDLAPETDASLSVGRDEIANDIEVRGWKAIQPHTQLRSRILLIRNSASRSTSGLGSRLRRMWSAHGLSVSAYDNGYIRISGARYDTNLSSRLRAALESMNCKP